MNQAELIKEIINQVRLEASHNLDLLLLSHLQMHHGADNQRMIGEKMQEILECKKQRFKHEIELIRKYGGQEE